jgi:membrane protease subunit HflK
MSWDWEKLKEQQQRRSGEPPKMDDLLKKNQHP